MPGFGEWVVAARINFTTNGILTMQRLAAASDMANASMLRQAGIIDKNELAMMRYQKRMEALHAQQTRMGTMVAGMGFVAGAAGLTFAVTEAAKLERAMTGVQIATGASSKDYIKLRAQALEVSGITAQSAVTIAQEMQRAATTAFHDPKQLMSLFPMMAKYADVRYMASGDNPVTSIEKMSQFAHFFAAYSPKDMAHMLDNTARLQFTTHAELNQLVTQGRYFIPNAVKLGVKQDTIFQYLAIMGQLGFLQGKGGTSLNNTILNAMSVTPTTHLSKAKAQGLRDLHMLNPDGTLKFIDAKGNLDLVGMVTHLREIRDIMKQQSPRVGGSNWMRDVGAIFGKQGQVLVSALADNTTAAQMGRNQQAFNRIPGVQGQWKLYSGDLFYQWNAFTTNLRNLFASIALPVLPKLTAFFHALNDGLGPLVAMIAAHPNLGSTIFGIGAAMTVAFGIRTIAGIFALTGAITNLGRVAGAASIAVGAEGAAAGAAGAAGVGGGIFAWADRVLFAGLFGALAKLGASIFPKVVVPILSFVNKLGPIGTKLTAIALGVDRFGGALGGLFEVLGRFGGPIGGGLGVLIDDLIHHRNPLTAPSEGSYLDANLPHRGGTNVHIGAVHLSIDPKNASKDPILQQLLQKSGVNKWSPMIPAPLTVGGAAFGR